MVPKYHVKQIWQPEFGSGAIVATVHLWSGIHFDLMLENGRCDGPIVSTGCSFRWIVVAESIVRWFVVREKHC
jgi:hypothetical protein